MTYYLVKLDYILSLLASSCVVDTFIKLQLFWIVMRFQVFFCAHVGRHFHFGKPSVFVF